MLRNIYFVPILIHFASWNNAQRIMRYENMNYDLQGISYEELVSFKIQCLLQCNPVMICLYVHNDDLGKLKEKARMTAVKLKRKKQGWNCYEMVCNGGYLPDSYGGCREARNIAPHQRVVASTVRVPLKYVNDGIPGNDFYTHWEPIPWLYVDFLFEAAIQNFTLRNRNGCCRDRLSQFNIYIGNEKSAEDNAMCLENLSQSGILLKDYSCPSILVGRYFHIKYLPTGVDRVIQLSEIYVYGVVG